MTKSQKPAKDNGFSRWLKQMVSPLYNVYNGIKIGIWVMKNPSIFYKDTFSMLNEILKLIMKVSYENRPYLTDIVITNKTTGVSQPIVHIWAGSGASADPILRIKELTEEIELLKYQIMAD